MKNFHLKYRILYLLSLVLLSSFYSCTKDPNSPGYEYSDDMSRSQAIEAYVDYGMVGDKVKKHLKNTISAKTPPKSTVPYFEDKSMANVHMPYNYGSSDEDRKKADTAHIIPVLYVNNEAIVKEGKRLYGIFCAHCHGKDGKGGGPVSKVTNDYIVCPDLSDKTTEIQSPGAIFHVITHGKGMMGPHASQLNKDERWKLVQYIRTELKGYTEVKENEESEITNVLTDSTDTNIN